MEEVIRCFVFWHHLLHTNCYVTVQREAQDINFRSCSFIFLLLATLNGRSALAFLGNVLIEKIEEIITNGHLFTSQTKFL